MHQTKKGNQWFFGMKAHIGADAGTGYVVTEYGVASLRGKTARQRAGALIEIAHPDFRDELRERARDLHLL
jgi:acyl-CoA hydrolase